MEKITMFAMLFCAICAGHLCIEIEHIADDIKWFRKAFEMGVAIAFERKENEKTR